MLVRAARPEDADAVFRLASELTTTPDREVFQETYDGYFGNRSPEVDLFVIEDDAHTVRGYALLTVTRLLYTNGPAAQLQEIVVDREARGQEYGRTLVQAVEGECRARGVTQLTVASRRAGGFYDRLGYSSAAEYMRRTF